MSHGGQVTIAALLFLFQLSASPARQIVPTEQGESRIVFLSNRDRLTEPGRAFDVFVLDRKSLKTENLTLGMADVVVRSNSQPRLDSRKNLVLFISHLGRSLVALNLETRTVSRIVDIAYEATNYTVSPDGETILYVERVDSVLQLFEVDVAGGGPRNLSHNRYNNFEASYSPDGKHIAYVCTADGSNSIAVMTRTGSGQRIVTNNFGDDRYPHWSSDSKKIIFSSSRSGTTDAEYHLYTIDAGGGNFKLLYQSKAFNVFPVFSPDNRYVAFVTNGRGGMHKDIVIKNFASGLIQPITFELSDSNERFSICDGGKSIVFENSGPVDSRIMHYDVQSKTTRPLTSGKGRNLAPSTGEENQASQ
jgi:Tol biopolymer transport system component